MGRVRIDGNWQPPKRISDRSALLLDHGSVLLGPSSGAGAADIIWLDTREQHRTLFEIDGYTKLYHKSFDAAAESSAMSLTPEGKYFVEFFAPVEPSPSGRAASEIVYFRGRRNELGRRWVRDEAGLYALRLDGSKASWPEPILTGLRGGEREEISGAIPLRTKVGGLLVIYRSATERSYETPVEESNATLRVVRFHARGKREFATLARGVAESEFPFDSVRAVMDAEGRARILFQGSRPNGEQSSAFDGGYVDQARPLFLLVTDTHECASRVHLTDASLRGHIDVAVDWAGRNHVVWVERTAQEMKLIHALVLMDNSTGSAGATSGDAVQRP
jgi:hypothetical protein